MQPFESSSATPVAVPGYDNKDRPLRPMASSDMDRLFWTLQGDLGDSIQVMPGEYMYDHDLEPYYRSSLDGDKWHSISGKPATVPPVSNLFVEVEHLARWYDLWSEMHEKDLDLRVFQDKHGNETEDSEDEDGEFNNLIRCCGRERPPDSVKLEVRASAMPFVTIQDYVSAVHPWLMELRDDILLAMNPETEFTEPLPKETKLVVTWLGAEWVRIEELEAFKAFARFATGGRMVVQNVAVSGRSFTTTD